MTEICDICGDKSTNLVEYYPHKAGDYYCIFFPRDDIERVCGECSQQECQICGKSQPRFGGVDCDKCGMIHCYNRTDMITIIKKGKYYIPMYGEICSNECVIKDTDS